MYSITVKDRCAYALSLKLGNAPLFRTGVTALVDAKLSGPELGPDGLLIDFVAVQLALGATLAPLQNADLDRLRPFAGRRPASRTNWRPLTSFPRAGASRKYTNTASASRPRPARRGSVRQRSARRQSAARARLPTQLSHN